MEKVVRSIPESVKIEDGISELKSIGIWPKNVVNPIPAYSDENGTLYLQILLKEFTDRHFKYNGHDRVIVSRNPLSLNRSVCVIADPDDEVNALLKSNLTELGVVGEITITSIDDITEEVLQKCDTIILASEVSDDTVKLLWRYIRNAPGKTIFRFNINKKIYLYKKKLSVLLNSTVIIPKVSDSSFLIKVGHTGMSDNEIEENILSVFRNLNFANRFPGGWSAIKTLNLKTGTSQAVSIYETPDMQITMSKRMKRKLETNDNKPLVKKSKRETSGDSLSKKQSGEKIGADSKKSEIQSPKKKVRGAPAESPSKDQTEAASPNLKRTLKDVVQESRPVSVSPKKQRKEKKAKMPESPSAVPQPTEAVTNGSPPKDSDASRLKVNKKTQKAQAKPEDKEKSLDTNDLLSMLINQAKMSVLSPAEESAEIATAPGHQSKKNKKNKSPKKQGGAKNLVPVQKDGELSDEFKMNMLERLQMFTRGTELEDIIVDPKKAEKNSIFKIEGLAKKTAEVKAASAVSPGSPKKKKNKKKSLTAVNSAAPLANGNAEVKAAAELPEKNTPEKKKNKKKASQGVNEASLVANENSSVTANMKSVANGSAGKTTHKKGDKTAKKANQRSPGTDTDKAQVTKVVALESPGTKLKKKKKNKSPKKAKVATL